MLSVGSGDGLRSSNPCNGADADVLADEGLGQTGLASYCTAVGVTLSTSADVAECLIRHHTCRVGQLLDAEAPRAREFLDIVGVAP